MAKTIQVSDDNGSTWYTLPGGTGEISREAGQVNDTIFGQTFRSQEIALINWSIGANALYKGFAGYKATIKKTGTSTAMTDEAMELVSGKRYRITNTAKRIMNRAIATVVEDSGSAVDAANILYINYLFGEVEFVSGYTVNGAITITGEYLAVTTLGKANGFTLTQEADAIQNTDFATAQSNGGYHTHTPGLRTVSLDLDGIFDASAGLDAILLARTEVLIEINPDGNSKSIARGYFKLASDGQSGDVGALEEESASFVLNVPEEDKLEYPFGWWHASDTTLSTAIQKLLTAWSNEDKIDVQYLYDGTNGYKGDAVITELSLSSGLEDMNEFSVSFAGDGALTDVP